MNFAVLMMSSVWIAGADPAACVDCVVPTTTICDSCATPAVPGLLARLKAKLPGADCTTCLPSSGLFTRLKSKLQLPEPSCSTPAGAPSPCSPSPMLTFVGAPLIGGCHLPPVPAAVPAAPSTTPQEMPKPDAPKSNVPKPMPKPPTESVKTETGAPVAVPF